MYSNSVQQVPSNGQSPKLQRRVIRFMGSSVYIKLIRIAISLLSESLLNKEMCVDECT